MNTNSDITREFTREFGVINVTGTNSLGDGVMEIMSTNSILPDTLIFPLRTRKKRRVLWVSNIGYQCSYHYISKVIVSNLAAQSNIEVYVFCTGSRFIDPSIVATEFKIPISNVIKLPIIHLSEDTAEETLYKSNYLGGIYSINNVINELNPHMIISLNDTEPLKRQYAMLSDNNKQRFIPYMTVDCADIIPKWFPNFGKMLTLTNFAKKEIKKLYSDCIVDVIPHPIDSKQFIPIKDKYQRELSRKKWNLPLNVFIVGSINANHIRKRWDLCIETFCRFAVNKDDTFLLIKTNKAEKTKNDYSITPFKDYDLNRLVYETCQKYDIPPTRYRIIDGFYSDADLNELYNCCDVGLSMTSGEGFGLTPCEMALCEVPQVITGFTSFPEIFSENYFGLVKTTLIPHYLGRFTDKSLSWYKNQYICIFKSFKNYQRDVTEKYLIDISRKIPTVIVSKHGEDSIKTNVQPVLNIDMQLLEHFRTIQFAKQYYENHCDKLNTFQLIISCDLDFLKEQYTDIIGISDDKFLNRDDMHYIVTKNKYIKELASAEFATVGLPSIDDACDKLNHLYQSEEFRITQGEFCRKRILENYNTESIIQQFIEYINTPKRTIF
jgi:hypothetical protein